MNSKNNYERFVIKNEKFVIKLEFKLF